MSKNLAGPLSIALTSPATFSCKSLISEEVSQAPKVLLSFLKLGRAYLMVQRARYRERRKKVRFEMERELRFKLLENSNVVEVGAGQTLNLSSGGVAFTATRPLNIGAYVELSISWPVLLNGTCPIRLIVLGKILRSESAKMACKIERHEFRTQARNYQPAPMQADMLLRRWVDTIARRASLHLVAARA
jgi:hypothetical protein